MITDPSPASGALVERALTALAHIADARRSRSTAKPVAGIREGDTNEQEGRS